MKILIFCLLILHFVKCDIVDSIQIYDKSGKCLYISIQKKGFNSITKIITVPLKDGMKSFTFFTVFSLFLFFSITSLVDLGRNQGFIFLEFDSRLL